MASPRVSLLRLLYTIPYSADLIDVVIEFRHRVLFSFSTMKIIDRSGY